MDGNLLVRMLVLASVRQTSCMVHHSRLHHIPGSRLRHYSSSLQRLHEVRLVEVGPRDGLQNIQERVPTATKIELIQRLADTGLKNIEATSFVSPKWVPQLADGAKVLGSVLGFAEQMRFEKEPLNFPVLAPNLKGLENANEAGAKEIVVFASVTEPFSRANQNCSVDEALHQAEAVAKNALSLGMKVRSDSVISCIFSDPFSGPTRPEAVVPIVQRLLDMGCYEVGLGDTLGVGTPADVQKLLHVLLPVVPVSKLAGHFHDTYGQGIANIVKAYDMGIRNFDSSVAGLGGCPYAPGAKGNVATEDVIYTLEKAGIHTGVDLEKLIAVGQWISKEIGIPYGSRVGAALTATKASQGATKREPIGTAGSLPVKPSRTWAIVQDTGEYRLSRAGTCIKVTLTRPKNGNALTKSMLEGLTSFFQNVAKDPTVYHIVLESEGKYFCTGMDLSGKTKTSDMSAERSYYDRVFALYDAIDHVPQTTISVVDGPCFGGGVGLTFVCDVRLVSQRARWTLSEIKIGVSPAVISKFLVREWGPSMARECMISGREIQPEELARVGAVHAVVKDSELLADQVDAYLDQLDRCAPRSAAINKKLSRLGWDAPESVAQAELIKSTFACMMAPSSEGEHGIQQFRKKQKTFSWREFWADRNPYKGFNP
ncbi:hydroxymethylglutaryl-lyase [Grosmannia clavigera kw1407]|uniref:hydroxymethylglutaryl-CoA lyase n=1 Tax=Grosmannia clavigera (strain kw1407 / UAMH 11150) TaxID=655863 RepID=F0XL57_GROCL|nr:hydroxymethylglutaryl-lyase [Grosmannia clavigera kw1407]EFX01628.1 hydroxymethylglutaryl-lyase [Grosmannia clavigera kw1407]